MASKVMVKMPVPPFAGNAQVTKNKSNDVVVGRSGAEMRATEQPPPPCTAGKMNGSSTPPAMVAAAVTAATGKDTRVAQLEQNIKYLQEQHQLMLTGLHHEIDCLRHRNRELQFQLVFAKGTNASTPSSPEDDKQKLYSNSPKVLNITPLQVEILEKELGEMKIQLQESECRNVYLSAIVDEQKKKLERYERDRERERERGIQPDPELLRKLDDAESLIRRLRRENSDLRRENAAAAVAYQPSTQSQTQQQPQQQQQQQTQQQQQPQHQREYQHSSRSGGQRRRGGGGGGGHNGGSGQNATNAYNGGGGGGAQQNASAGGPSAGAAAGGGGGGVPGAGNPPPFRPNWFPPLHTQNYWQQQNRPQQSHVDSLPQLQQSTGSHHVVYSPQVQQNHGGGRRGGNNNNHYQNGERKYRASNHQNRGQKSS